MMDLQLSKINMVVPQVKLRKTMMDLQQLQTNTEIKKQSLSKPK